MVRNGLLLVVFQVGLMLSHSRVDQYTVFSIVYIEYCIQHRALLGESLSFFFGFFWPFPQKDSKKCDAKKSAK